MTHQGRIEGSAFFLPNILVGSLPEPAAKMYGALLGHITLGLLSLPSPVPASFLL